MDEQLAFVHRLERPAKGEASDITLVLLHGTGGDESDLIPLGRGLFPGATLLSLRGRVLENGMPRFFRRFAEGVFDLEDMRLQTDEMARFLDKAAHKYSLSRDKMIAVGYSNGANIAASLLLRYPGSLAGAVLLRAMVPFVPSETVSLAGAPVLLCAGTRDSIATPAQTAALTEILTKNGAKVTTHWHPGGHELGNDDLAAAQKWLSEQKV